jgi:putative MATE family efflux protein
MKKELLSFLKKILIISLPIILQQLFLNFASFLDTLMVGQLDESSTSGVYVATQIIFVGNLMIFGSVEGAGVFFSQFFGQKNKLGLRNCYAYKYIFSLLIALFETICIYAFGKDLVGMFLKDQQAFNIAVDYLNIVGVSIIPFAISITISSTLREAHKIIPPTIITFVGIVFNFIFNLLFIYGYLGFPRIGASGAAIGTLINRIIEVVLLVLYVCFTKPDFSEKLSESFKIEKTLFKKMTIKSIPLFINETLWSLSQIVLVFFFTEADPIATTVLPIVQTTYNLLFVVLLGLGSGITIVVGNKVGEGDFESAQRQAFYSLLFTFISCLVLGVFMIAFADVITSLYTGIDIIAKDSARILLRFSSFTLLLAGLNTTLFFLLRAGGKTEIVFLFDSFYCWVVSIPVAYVLSEFTSLSFEAIYMLIYSIEIIKTLTGIILLLSKKWYKNLISDLPNN